MSEPRAATATIPGAGVMIKDMADDEAIQATNDDASESKRYAVQLGYWCDPFISLFVKQTARKAPEINRGYYARVKGIELFVDKFLKVSASLTRLSRSSFSASFRTPGDLCSFCFKT